MKVGTLAMLDSKHILEQIDRLYAELADLKRYVVKQSVGELQRSPAAWQDLVEASAEISKRWSGPGTAEEIRSQREK